MQIQVLLPGFVKTAKEWIHGQIGLRYVLGNGYFEKKIKYAKDEGIVCYPYP